jgi:hypothetical protein
MSDSCTSVCVNTPQLISGTPTIKPYTIAAHDTTFVKSYCLLCKRCSTERAHQLSYARSAMHISLMRVHYCKCMHLSTILLLAQHALPLAQQQHKRRIMTNSTLGSTQFACRRWPALEALQCTNTAQRLVFTQYTVVLHYSDICCCAYLPFVTIKC